MKLAMETAQCPIDFDDLRLVLESKFGVKTCSAHIPTEM